MNRRIVVDRDISTIDGAATIWHIAGFILTRLEQHAAEVKYLHPHRVELLLHRYVFAEPFHIMNHLHRLEVLREEARLIREAHFRLGEL